MYIVLFSLLYYIHYSYFGRLIYMLNFTPEGDAMNGKNGQKCGKGVNVTVQSNDYSCVRRNNNHVAGAHLGSKQELFSMQKGLWYYSFISQRSYATSIRISVIFIFMAFYC